jgi:hypothetical protein
LGPSGLGIGPCGQVDHDVLLAAFEDDVGNKIEVYCEDHAPYVDEYQMYITRADGADPGGHIGRCPYIGGQNSPRLFYTGDYAPANGKPDCFLNTVWTSVDGGDDDDGDGRLDYTQTLYNVLENIREYRPDLDMGPHPSTSAPSSILLAEASSVTPPMTISPFEPCDLNRDGSCGASDRDVFDGAYGSQLGEPNYQPFADFNGDGVVDELDAGYLGFSGPIPVDDLTEVQFSGISHDRRRKISRTLATVTNTSSVVVPTPLFLVVVSVSDPFVTVANADGITIDGKPFFDITDHVPGVELDPAEVTNPVTLMFDNPLLRRFTLEAEVRAEVVSE